MIEKCWSQGPYKRPSFLEIIEELKTNEEFINEDVDKNECLAYIKYIDEYMKSTEKASFSIEDFFHKENIKLIKVDLAAIKKEHSHKLQEGMNIQYVNLNDFNLLNKISEGNFGDVYKVLDKKAKKICVGKISKFETDQFIEYLLISHYREVEILSKLNHPINFENEESPVIFTEFTPEGTLEDVLKLERNSLSPGKWNNTTKIINIYGITLRLMYLHHLNIIHRDL